MPTVSVGSWVTRQHPNHSQIKTDEQRQRASYIATRREMVRYLVPHRFESSDPTSDPTKLRRSLYGFALGLNKSYLQDIFGFVRGAPALYQWGPMEETGEQVPEGEETPPKQTPPAGGLASQLWTDATRDNVTWRNFFLRKVLEWMLSSPGGFVLVNTPANPDGTQPTIAEAVAKGIRPYTVHLPWSQIEDWGRWELGYQFIKIVTQEEVREPKDDLSTGDQRIRVLYELNTDTGSTTISKWDANGDQIGATIDLGIILDRQGQFTLPFVNANYGEYEGLEYVGAGLIADLADNVIDLFNIWSEAREGFRDAAFGVTAYIGSKGKTVQEALDAGTRFVDLGDDDNADLKRVAGNVEEVSQGLALMDFGVKAWMEAARSNAAEAQARATAKSGIALQAEFQLDLAPLLKEVSETLDQIESDTMFIAGQLGGFTAEELEGVGVKRQTEFRPEEETGRIARIVGEFRKMGLPLPEDLAVGFIMQWAESVDFIDLDQEIEFEGDENLTRRDLIRRQAEEAVAQAAVSERNQAAFLLGAGGGEVTEPGEEGLPGFEGS